MLKTLFFPEVGVEVRAVGTRIVGEGGGVRFQQMRWLEEINIRVLPNITMNTTYSLRQGLAQQI